MKVIAGIEDPVVIRGDSRARIGKVTADRCRSSARCDLPTLPAVRRKVAGNVFLRNEPGALVSGVLQAPPGI
jgi:hypothetical protein